MFDKEKKERLSTLYKPDASPIGNVDLAIRPLLDLINENENYYTMSSCSGRTSISKEKGEGKGLDWLFVSHNKVDEKEVLNTIKNLSGTVYFRYEGLILHICARNIEAANELLILAQNNGFKHAGIISLSKKIVIELIDMLRIDVPIFESNKLIVSNEYIKTLVSQANKKLEKSHLLIKRFEKVFK